VLMEPREEMQLLGGCGGAPDPNRDLPFILPPRSPLALVRSERSGWHAEGFAHPAGGTFMAEEDGAEPPPSLPQAIHVVMRSNVRAHLVAQLPYAINEVFAGRRGGEESGCHPLQFNADAVILTPSSA
jgi:hypothetical protein